MRLGRLANLLTVIGVVLALAGAATALAAARAPDPGTTAPAPVARSTVHSVMNAPEADGASGRAVEPAPRVSADPASTISETGIPRKAANPPDSPIASSFVKNGPAVAVAVLETVKPSVPVEGPDLRIVTAGAARDAAGRNGAGPVFQQAGITSYDITLKPGSNLISLPLMPDDTAIEAVLAGILDRVETVWQYDTSGPDPKWRSYAPGAPSDLRVMRDGPGYWVHLKHDVAGDAVLTITGGDATGPARRVVQGWNLVGFTATTAGDAATDRAALVALYNATDGANWLNNDNWLSNAPIGEWHGVTTDSDGRVTRLWLARNQLTGSIPAELGNLANLTQLVLDINQLTGGIPAELGDLTNLERLKLSFNELTGGIPAELGSLTNLEELYLAGNQLTGGIPAELGDLTYLRWLDLAGNQLTGEIPAELGSLTNLKRLFLNTNQLTGGIPAELGSLTNLEWLQLQYNQLTGEIPAELGSLTNLKELWLGDNRLTGEIPAELGNLTNLAVLALFDNQLTGEIPAWLGSLTNLKELRLHNNQLTGGIPAGLGNLTNLERLWLSGNQLTGEIPAELGSLTNLKDLRLGGNQLTGEIPAGLGSLTNLEWLYLNDNQLTGEIPAELGNLTNLTNLRVLWLAGNQLTGCIPGGLRDVPLNDLTQLGLDYCMPATTAGDAATDRAALVALYNATDGANWHNNGNWLSNAPMGVWHGVTTDSDGRVTHLDLQRNQLTGEIPAELGSLTNLTDLRLTFNQLTGEIPAELGSLTNLERLGLYDNRLTGGIPAELGSLTNLEGLSLSGNQLTGGIPAEFGSLTNLESLDLSFNQLTGEIPAEFGSLTNLIELGLNDNQLTGEIPAWLGSLTNLEGMYLAANQLTGEIPAELGSLTNLTDLRLGGNQLTGGIPAELGNLTNLTGLYLSGNQLTGGIPAELGSLTYLTVLFLGGNGLTGCIPNGLRGIETNDLSLLGLPFCDMPGAPTIATPIVPGDASLTVAWAAPINTGSSAITAYDLRYIETGAADKSDANWTVVEDVWAAGSGSLQYTLSGLTGGTQYDVQVRAVNAAGASAWSATVTGTTTSAVVPGAPTGLTAAVAAGKAQVVLSWIAPTDTVGAPITGYKIEASDDGNNPWTEVYTTTGDATGYTDEGADSNGPMFEVGTTRHYRVSAINSVGTGPPSNVAVTEGLVDRYDTNGNGTIEKNEVIAAINDYLFGEGDQAISKSDVIKLINDYLFG